MYNTLSLPGWSFAILLYYGVEMFNCYVICRHFNIFYIRKTLKSDYILELKIYFKRSEPT